MPKKKSSKNATLALTLKDKLNAVIGEIMSTCEAKGWSCEVDSIDEKKGKYASVRVERWLSGAGTVTGLFDITVNGGVKVMINRTSFHSHGLSDLHDSIMDDLSELPWLEKKKKENGKSHSNAFEQLERLLKRFHIVAKQLKHRHDDRETLIIEDEYDVQDFVHSLLRINFEDVRPEEYTPSYAGSSSKLDFLLKKEGVVIEVKMASKKLRDKLVGEQLIIDIKKYQKHPDCKTLYCFVYDPSSFIKNPVALENDLSGKHPAVSEFMSQKLESITLHGILLEGWGNGGSP